MPSAQPDPSSDAQRRLLLVQFGGDFREADRLLRETGQETYYNHRHILDTLAKVHQDIADTSIMCCRTTERYTATLSSGVTAIGVGADPYRDPRAIIDAIRRVDATDIIFLGPMDGIVGPSLERGARALCMWADSFPPAGPRTYLWRRRLRRQLNDPRMEWVTNHGRNASRSLVTLGVRAEKVFAWDYTHHEDPAEFEARNLQGGAAPRLFLAGTIVESKGTFDAVDAIARLRKSGIDATLRIAGSGDDDLLRKRIDEQGLSRAVTPLGLLPNTEVFREMRDATAVLVPSRHDYPEGQPLTINEALRARTPIVASDHPMFDGILSEGISAVVFAAGDSDGLADAVGRLHGDPDLYRRLSERSVATWDQMAVDVKWGELVLRWTRNSAEDQAWLIERHSDFVGA